VALFLIFLALLSPVSAEYRKSIEKWRTDRETRLKAEDGWLTLVGLFWLEEGRNTVGSAQSSTVALPPGFPARAGVLERKGEAVTWKPATGDPRPLMSDKQGKPDILEIGRLRLHVIARGAKVGVRMKDNDSEYRRNFAGLKWFPVREDWRVTAKFVPFSVPRKKLFDAQAGDKQEMLVPGYAEFEHGGRTFRLTPALEGDQLFFIFRDKTAGKTTYPAARFLYSDMPKNGRVELDFNKAYNPPCVFTPYATCPLPPPENRMNIPVEAGELMYAGH
jgi:uncharacterized protein (DUF1684 family)